MKSIKPGRAPSMMVGVMGIFMVCFGIVWTALASQASGIFALFGVLWTCAAIAITIYNFKNATGKNRYSAYDITDSNEEPDPLNERFGSSAASASNRFCPYCGAQAKDDFEYCNKCGRKLP